MTARQGHHAGVALADDVGEMIQTAYLDINGDLRFPEGEYGIPYGRMEVAG
ncbi:MAG: hypothetical protein V1766_03380 [Pseudomonadota bacterium]